MASSQKLITLCCDSMVDAHAHIQMPPLVDEWEALYDRAKLAGVTELVVVGESLRSSRDTIDLCRSKQGLYPVVGVHPTNAAELADEEGKRRFEDMLTDDVRAVGEIGLDYYWITQQSGISDSSFAKASEDKQKKAQRDAFEWQIGLANQHDLPIVIHSREAGEDTLAVLSNRPPTYALMHCYSYDLKTAEAFLAMHPQNMIAFTGILTFPNAKTLQDVCRHIPLERMLTESDCPYLAPQKYRGQRNEPAYIVEIVRKIAELKGISFEEVARVTGENARRFFGF